MSIVAAISARDQFRRDTAVPPAAPPASTFRDLVLALDVTAVYPLNDQSLAGFTDIQSGYGGTWTNTGIEVARPTMVDGDASGYSSEFNGGRGVVPANAAFQTTGGGLFLVFQTRDDTTKQTLISRAQGDVIGRSLIEIPTGGGKIRATVRDAVGSVELLTGAATVTKGTIHAVALTMGAAGAKLYLDSGVPAATDVTTQGPANSSEISIGSWHTGSADRFSGLMGWVVVFGSQPSDANIASLMGGVTSGSILWANQDDLGEVVKSTAASPLDVSANDHFSGAKAAATLSVTVQGSLGTWAVDGNKDLVYTAGATTGADTAGRYTINGSAAAALSATVVEATGQAVWSPDLFAALPSGFGTWVEAWVSDTHGITQPVIDANQNTFHPDGVYPWRRFSMDSPDNLPAVRETFSYPLTISPVGFDSPHLTAGPLATLDQIRYIMFSWHYFSTEYWGEEGKYHIINGGRGYTGNSYSKSDTTQYGTDGFGYNSMHPRAGGDSKNQPGGENNWGGFAVWQGVSPDSSGRIYGGSLQKDDVRIGRNQWVPVRQICDLGANPGTASGAYRLYAFEQEVARKTGILLALGGSYANCKGVWSRYRTMSGGNPDQLRFGHNPGNHFYGGFSIHYVAR